jgi:hypothetical protein
MVNPVMDGRRWHWKLQIVNGKGVKPPVPWGESVDLD